MIRELTSLTDNQLTRVASMENQSSLSGWIDPRESQMILPEIPPPTPPPPVRFFRIRRRTFSVSFGAEQR